MITQQGGQVFALADRCCHRGGPLHEGSFADGCVTCPWHQSRFRLSDGAIVQGPATYPQPSYDVRVSEGTIEVRARLSAGDASALRPGGSGEREPGTFYRPADNGRGVVVTLGVTFGPDHAPLGTHSQNVWGRRLGSSGPGYDAARASRTAAT